MKKAIKRLKKALRAQQPHLPLKLMGELRFVDRKDRFILQQLWLNENTGELVWRDVEMVKE